MTTKQENPLQAYFRQPSVYITLPSKGEFYGDAIIKSESGEIPVYSMTSMDEIAYKTPDALFNGESIVTVIKSCVPSITDPWKMPIIDLTSVLIAIKIASSGHMFEVTSVCPACGDEADYGIDLRPLLDTMSIPDFSKPLEIGDLKIYLRPINYKESNDNNKISFKEQQLAAVIENEDVSEDEKIKIITESFIKVSNFTLETITKNIDKIVISGTEVSDPKFILEFLQQCESKIYKQIKDTITSQRAVSEIEPMKITCSEEKCKHQYDQPFTLDMTTFFE